MKEGVEAVMSSSYSFFFFYTYDLKTIRTTLSNHILFIIIPFDGAICDVEVKIAIDRADIVIKMPDAVYVIEFKVDEL